LQLCAFGSGSKEHQKRQKTSKTTYNLLHDKRASCRQTTPHLLCKCHDMLGHVIIIICCMLLPKSEHGDAYAPLFMTARRSPLLAGNMWTVFKGCMTNSLFICRRDGKHPPWLATAPAANIPMHQAGTIGHHLLDQRTPGLRLATATAAQKTQGQSLRCVETACVQQLIACSFAMKGRDIAHLS
jgi:hypothetical protein